MTAWAILVNNSTAPSGSTAWENLLNQKVGTPFPIENLSVDFSSDDLNVDFIVDSVEGSIEEVFTVDIVSSPVNGDIIINNIDSLIC